MSDLGELLGVDHRQAIEFFFIRLGDVSGPVNREELRYNASILAHYAQVSTSAGEGVAAPADLSSVFDNFVVDASLCNDAQMLETAAVQCLILTGFFKNQMQARHNISWYAKLGAGFFIRSAHIERSQPKVRLLYKMSRDFEAWRRRHAELSRELRDQPYLL
jgi:hypothetical protein